MKQKDAKRSMNMVTIPLKYDEDAGADKAVAIPSMIHIIPTGEWNHDMYGPMTITNNDIREFMANFNAGIRKGVFITAGHEGFMELPAVAWMKSLEMRDNGLWAEVEWNELGKEALNDKQFKFFSPEFYRDYEDPQTHQVYRNVLTGGALTKSPYFKELEAIVFSDKAAMAKFNTNTNNTMDLTSLVAKDITTLTDEEKAFIKENKEQLTDEQKTALTAVLDEVVEVVADPAPIVETPAADQVVETPVVADPVVEVAPVADPAPVAETVVVEPTAEVLASEMAGLTPQAFSQMKKDAEAGKIAMAELKKAKLDTEVKGMVFSEGNQTGKFLPKSADNLRAFMETLNEAQTAKFSTLVTQLPSLTMFKEIGGSSDLVEGTAQAEVESKIKASMEADGKLTYGDAMKKVMSENEGLAERYNAEVTGKVSA